MVLRKPYAFLIKNFKLIHVLLTILMGCMFKKMRDIVEYLDEYIGSGLLAQVPEVIEEQFGICKYLANQISELHLLD